MLGEVGLKNFRLTDWFPRAPGVYWGPRAAMARDEVMMRPLNDDPYLGKYISNRALPANVQTSEKCGLEA